MKSSKKLQKNLVISFFITIFALEIKVINIKTIGKMFNYKVSYNKSWNVVGTCYNQMITITIPSKNTLFDINKTISDFRDNSNDFFTCTIYTDSAYCYNCYKEKWYENWRLNNWITSSKTKVKNIDLWKQLVLFFEDVRFNLVKVKGHSGLDFNEMADRIATQSIRGDK